MVDLKQIQILVFTLLYITSSISAQEPPKLQQLVLPNHFKEGQAVKLLCSLVEGTKPLTFEWKKDGHSLISRDNVKISTYDDFSVMDINQVSSENSGNYTCIVKNKFGSDNFTAHVEVRVPPQWKSEPQDRAVTIGSEVIIPCQGSGFPFPVVKWSKMAAGGTNDFEVKSENGDLHISKAQLQDEGRYICEITNGIGKGLKKVIVLSVHGKSEPSTKVVDFFQDSGLL